MDILIGVAVVVLGAAIIGVFTWCFRANVSLAKLDSVDVKLDIQSDAVAQILAHQEMAKAYYDKVDKIDNDVVELKIKVAKLEEYA
jgi:hypothetical protein